MSEPVTGTLRLIDLEGEARARALPVLEAGFTGVYRWHAKRTLRKVRRVRAVELDSIVVGVSLLERLVPEVGYVYYLSVLPSHRRAGVGSLLLDDALSLFRSESIEVVYAAVPRDNRPSLALFASRGFRLTERKERGYREGGLGAWGLRSRMWVVSGEELLGLRIAPSSGSVAAGDPTGSRGGSKRPTDPDETA